MAGENSTMLQKRTQSMQRQENLKILNELITLFQNGRLAQVYLFYGNHQSTAQSLAVHVLAKSTGFSEDLVKKHVENGTFPNFFGVEESEITVDRVRELSVFLQDTPALDGWRVVIIHPADALNISASNAMLKNMEELPAKTTIILLANSLYGIRSTILSRSQKVFFPRKICTDEEQASTWERDSRAINDVLKQKRMPAQATIDEIAKDSSRLAEAVKHVLYVQCMENLKNTYVNSAKSVDDSFFNKFAGNAQNDIETNAIKYAEVCARKYEEISDFANRAAGKSLAPAHFVYAIFSILNRSITPQGV